MNQAETFEWLRNRVQEIERQLAQVEGELEEAIQEKCGYCDPALATRYPDTPEATRKSDGLWVHRYEQLDRDYTCAASTLRERRWQRGQRGKRQ